MTDSPCAVTVIRPDGRKEQVNGRAARMLLLCLIYQDRLNGARRGHFKLNFDARAGERIIPELLEMLEGN